MSIFLLGLIFGLIIMGAFIMGLVVGTHLTLDALEEGFFLEIEKQLKQDDLVLEIKKEKYENV